jgi:hypothetical protein
MMVLEIVYPSFIRRIRRATAQATSFGLETREYQRSVVQSHSYCCGLLLVGDGNKTSVSVLKVQPRVSSHSTAAIHPVGIDPSSLHRQKEEGEEDRISTRIKIKISRGRQKATKSRIKRQWEERRDSRTSSNDNKIRSKQSKESIIRWKSSRTLKSWSSIVIWTK